jgi:hypothetical protein
LTLVHVTNLRVSPNNYQVVALAASLAGARANKTTNHLFYCDFDRALHWIKTYPEELTQIVESPPDNDYVLIGRTKRAFQTHPKTQTMTEGIGNTLASKMLNFPETRDILSARTAVAGGSMDDTADDSDADGSGEDNAEEEDIAQGTIPVQGSPTGARALPVKVASESEGVIQKTPAKDRLVEELKKLQTRPRCDPNTVWWVREEHHEPEGTVREDTARALTRAGEDLIF